MHLSVMPQLPMRENAGVVALDVAGMLVIVEVPSLREELAGTFFENLLTLGNSEMYKLRCNVQFRGVLHGEVNYQVGHVPGFFFIESSLVRPTSRLLVLHARALGTIV